MAVLKKLKCFLGFHQYEKQQEYLYVEEVDGGIVLYFFVSLRCKRCGHLVEPDCFKKKWLEKHPPFSYEIEDYPGVMDKEQWRLWEVTKQKIFG